MTADKQFPASVQNAGTGDGSGNIAVRFKAGFTVALFLLVVTIGLTAKTGRNNAAGRQWVFHTQEVIECVTELSERANQRELGMRDYLRSGDAQFRASYDAVDRETKSLGDRLVALVGDNSTQTERAQRIRTLVEDRGRAINVLLDAYTPADSLQILASNVKPSSVMLDTMDRAILQFRGEERQLLVERQVSLDSSARFIDLMIPLIGLTGLFVLVGCQIALSRYLSQTRVAQAQTHAATQLADRANSVKSAFLANVSHEIRTPLAAIMGYSDMLHSEKITSPEERDEFLRIIRRSGEQVLTIVNDILDLSKIESGRMTTERIPCSIVEVIADVASLFRRVAVGRGLFFEVKYVGPIPEQVRTDPTRLRQALMNLVGNAVKFTEHGGVRLVIDIVHNGGVSPLLRVRVIDSGIGVSPEVVAKLFEPFIQADISTTRRFGGTGLGLTISRHFAELLGGTISVESEVGHGSTFTLTIATGDLVGIEMLTGVTEATKDPQSSVVTVPPRLNGRRILVAEDGPDNRQIILFYLRQVGADVMVAENGKIAVQLATQMAEANRPFDLILMDMQMPVMDGYTATTALRNSRYIGPIIALTANAMAHDRQKCLTAGCNGFITKPIQWPEFWATVRRFVTEASEATAAVRSGVVQTIATDTPTVTDPVAKRLPPNAKDMLAQLAAKFAVALPGRATDIRAAFEQKDRAKMKLLAHSLSGAAASFGFPEAGELARQLDLNYDADSNRVLDMLKALDSSVSRSLMPRAA